MGVEECAGKREKKKRKNFFLKLQKIEEEVAEQKHNQGKAKEDKARAGNSARRGKKEDERLDYVARRNDTEDAG